jgi:hypothetical protein
MRHAKPPAKSKPDQRQRNDQKLQENFPDVPKDMIWDRGRHHGFATVPRTMPIVMQAIKHVGIKQGAKGDPAGHTLLCLWIRAMDHPYMVIDNPGVFAAEAGLHGDRASARWRTRMKMLAEMGFIAAKSGDAGPFHHVLLLNPNKATVRLHANGLIPDDLYKRFLVRAEKVGAQPEIDEELGIHPQEEEGLADDEERMDSEGD